MGRESSLDRALTDERGSVLIGGMLLVLAVTLIGLGLFEAATIETRDVALTGADVRAFYAADAGLNLAALNLANDLGKDSNNNADTISFQSVHDSVPTTVYSALAGCPTASRPECAGWVQGSPATTANGSAAFTVSAVASTPPDPDKVVLIATGCVPGPAANPCPAGARAAAQVRAVIQRNFTTTTTTTTTVTSTTTTGPGMPYALFSSSTSTDPSIKMGGSGGMVDSYDSHAAGCSPTCNYNAATAMKNGDIGSNGSITIQSSVIVKGDIVQNTNVSAANDVTLSTGAIIDGNIKTGGTALTPTAGQVTGTVTQNTGSPQPTVTSVAACGPPYTDLTGKITQTDASGNVVAPTWTYGGVAGCTTCGTSGSKAGEFVAGSGIINLVPGTYCLSAITFHTTLKITDLTVISATGDVKIQSGSYLNNTTLDPENLQLVSSSTNPKFGVDINFAGDAYTTIVAPTTGVSSGSGGNLYGAVVADHIEFTGGSKIHFDEYLVHSSKLVAGISVSMTTTTTTTMTTTTTIGPPHFALASWLQTKCSRASLTSAWSCP